MNLDERQERLRAVTAEAARGRGGLRGDEASRAPEAGDLYVFPQTRDFPVEWALLAEETAASGSWLAVPADTNPLRGPGDVPIGAGEQGGPLWLRCRFPVRLPRTLLDGGRRTGALEPGATARALTTCREHQRGATETDPLAQEVAFDPEYQDWERRVLAAARHTLLAAASRAEGPAAGGAGAPPRTLWALAAGLTFLALGLGAWGWQLREEVHRLSEPVLLGGSREIVVGADVRGPVTLRVRPTEERLLVFLVLSGDAAGYPGYRVELRSASERILWASPEVERGALPELNLVIPRRFFAPAETSLRLVVNGVETDRSHRLAEIPIRIEQVQAAPEDR